MGKKGDKLQQASVLATEELVNHLAAIDGITSKKMFGGHGIFHDGKMFGIVDSKGTCYLKTDDSSSQDFIDKGSDKHGKMPYYTIPDDVLQDQSLITKWAQKSIDISK